MHGFVSKMRLAAFCFMIVCLSMPSLVAAAEKPIGSPWDGLMKKSSQERRQIYTAMQFETNFLFAGKVVWKKPFAVVASYDSGDRGTLAKIRVWKGLVEREGQDLHTSWDELWLDRDGKVSLAVTGLDENVEGYFSASSQKTFQKPEYLGKVPWAADIPTDAEAKGLKRKTIPEDGTINVYGLDLASFDVGVSTDQGGVALKQQIPLVQADPDIPSDVKNHWAENFIVHLLKHHVISGYEDHTIRPNKTLSRAEFIALLARAMDLKADPSSETGFSDLGNHWSKGAVAAAMKAGIVLSPEKGAKFMPNKAITRAEMVEMISRALKRYPLKLNDQQADFKDTRNMSNSQKMALSYVIRTGVIGGYPDGTFKPDNSLTRAEACRVISSMMFLVD